MKWLPPPSVPSWRGHFACTSRIIVAIRSWRARMRASPGRRAASTPRSATGSSWAAKPTGTAASIASRTGRNESGSRAASSVSRAALMPHPMSTPTAAGIRARRVAITDPTVAPMPRCTSGIAATWPTTIGSRETAASCRIDASSTSSVKILTGTPPRSSTWRTGMVGRLESHQSILAGSPA